MLMLLPIAPMRVEHHDVAPLERLAPDRAIEIIQALHPSASTRSTRPPSFGNHGDFRTVEK